MRTAGVVLVLILCLLVIIYFESCCIFSPQKAEIKQDSVKYIPPTITSQVLDSLGYTTSDDCAEQVSDAFLWAGNWAHHVVDSAGNEWNQTLQTKIDSAKKVKSGTIIYITRKDSNSVKPSPVFIPYQTSEIKLLSGWENFKLNSWWSLVILLLGSWILIGVFEGLRANPSAISDVLGGLKKLFD